MGAVVKNLAQTKFENRCVRQWNQVKTSEKSKWWHTYGVRPLFWTEVPIRTCLNLLIMLCAPCGAHLWPYRPHTYGHQICPIWCMIWGWCGPIHTGFLSSNVCMLNFLPMLGVSDFLIFSFWSKLCSNLINYQANLLHSFPNDLVIVICEGWP